MTSNGEPGFLLEQPLVPNQNITSIPPVMQYYHDPEMGRLLQEILKETKAARQAAQSHYRLYATVIGISTIIFVILLLLRLRYLA